MLIRDHVYQSLKSEILSGALKPGETLNILDISRRMNISGAPVREALNMLGSDGLVELSPYKKAVVAVGTEEDARASWELRLFTEPYAARLAVNHIPQEELEAVQRLVQKSMADPENLQLYLESDNATHALLQDHVPSRTLTSVLETLQMHTLRYRYFSQRNKHDPENTAHISQEHLDILDAIAMRDENLVYFRVYNHVRNAWNRNPFHSA